MSEDNTPEQEFEQLNATKAEKLLEESDVRQALRLAMEEDEFDRESVLDLLISSCDANGLKECGLIEQTNYQDGNGAKYLIRQKQDSNFDFDRQIVRLAKSTYEEIERGLTETVKEFESSDVEFPVDSDENVVNGFLDNLSEISNISAEIFFDNTGEYESYNEEKYGLPLLVYEGRKFGITDEGRTYLKENWNDLVRERTKFLENFRSSIGVGDQFTQLTKSNMTNFRTIFNELKDREVTETEISSVLLNLNEELNLGIVSKNDVQDTLEKIRR